jgi:hypothetical protein
MKAYGRVDVQTHLFLTSVLVGGEWSASCPGHFTTGERALGTHSIGGWVGRRTSLGDMEKRKFLLLPGIELRRKCTALRQNNGQCGHSWIWIMEIHPLLNTWGGSVLDRTDALYSGCIRILAKRLAIWLGIFVGFLYIQANAGSSMSIQTTVSFHTFPSSFTH